MAETLLAPLPVARRTGVAPTYRVVMPFLASEVFHMAVVIMVVRALAGVESHQSHPRSVRIKLRWIVAVLNADEAQVLRLFFQSLEKMSAAHRTPRFSGFRGSSPAMALVRGGVTTANFGGTNGGRIRSIIRPTLRA